MKISIITPNFDGGKFIEETINSVISQKGNFELEYIIVDGGSTDNSLEIIKKYDQKYDNITYKWISEKDSGQSEAINKGFKIANGEVINWLCSDDLLEVGALQKVVKFFEKNKNAKVVFGHNIFIDELGKVFRFLKSRSFLRKELIKRWNSVYNKFNLGQPSVFIKKEVLDKVGNLNINNHLCMDYEWYLKINKEYEFCFLNEVLSKSRYHKEAKSVKKEKQQYKEAIKVSKKYWKESPINFWISYIFYWPKIYLYFLLKELF